MFNSQNLRINGGTGFALLYSEHKTNKIMKKIIVTIAAAMMAFSVAAHNTDVGPGSYCVENRDGKTIVTHNGSELTKKIKLEGGTRLKPNGTLVFAGGKRVKLTEGECIDENNVGQLSNRKGLFEQRMDRHKERCKEKKEARKARREARKD